MGDESRAHTREILRKEVCSLEEAGFVGSKELEELGCGEGFQWRTSHHNLKETAKDRLWVIYNFFRVIEKELKECNGSGNVWRTGS